MFRLVANSLETNLSKNILINNQQTRSIRLRKPPWVPRAKSKQFRIPPLKERDMEEYNYMKPIWNQYKASMRSIYQLFKTENKFTDQASFKVKEEKRVLLEKENELLKMNDIINKEILEKQLIEEDAKLQDKKRLAEIELKKKQKIQELYFKKADEQVRKLKEKAKKFIDPNNLEMEIEKALNERYDHNFSIDTSGRFFKNKVIVTKLEAFDSSFIPVKKTESLNTTELKELGKIILSNLDTSKS